MSRSRHLGLTHSGIVRGTGGFLLGEKHEVHEHMKRNNTRGGGGVNKEASQTHRGALCFLFSLTLSFALLFPFSLPLLFFPGFLFCFPFGLLQGLLSFLGQFGRSEGGEVEVRPCTGVVTSVQVFVEPSSRAETKHRSTFHFDS